MEKRGRELQIFWVAFAFGRRTYRIEKTNNGDERSVRGEAKKRKSPPRSHHKSRPWLPPMSSLSLNARPQLGTTTPTIIFSPCTMIFFPFPIHAHELFDELPLWIWGCFSSLELIWVCRRFCCCVGFGSGQGWVDNYSSSTWCHCCCEFLVIFFLIHIFFMFDYLFDRNWWSLMNEWTF